MDWIQNIQEIPAPKQYIPRLLHIVWVGKSPQPETLNDYISKWKELMPHWNIRLWTNADLTEDEIRPEVLAKINEAEKGTQKADILKYYIVEKYGGVYMDADVEPVKNLDPLIYLSDIVICHEHYVTWEYIAVGFFAASPNHPALAKAVEMCLNTQLNTDSPNLTTGPGAFGRAISVTPGKYTLLPMETFYWKEGGWHPNRYGLHMYAKSWDT